MEVHQIWNFTINWVDVWGFVHLIGWIWRSEIEWKSKVNSWLMGEVTLHFYRCETDLGSHLETHEAEFEALLWFVINPLTDPSLSSSGSQLFVVFVSSTLQFSCGGLVSNQLCLWPAAVLSPTGHDLLMLSEGWAAVVRPSFFVEQSCVCVCEQYLVMLVYLCTYFCWKWVWCADVMDTQHLQLSSWTLMLFHECFVYLLPKNNPVLKSKAWFNLNVKIQTEFLPVSLPAGMRQVTGNKLPRGQYKLSSCKWEKMFSQHQRQIWCVTGSCTETSDSELLQNQVNKY